MPSGFQFIFEAGHEKMCLMRYANNKGADQPAHPRSLISAFVVRCQGRMILPVYICELSRFLMVSVVEQVSLCLARSEPPIDTFSHGVAHFQVVRHYNFWGQNVSSGISDQVRPKSACAATEAG